MKNTIFLQSDDGFSQVKITNGELISYQKKGVEYLHQKENLGWNHTDTEMFPIIGPTIKNNFKVITDKGVNYVDQHGFLREMNYSLISLDTNTAVFNKVYVKNTPILNGKYPEKSTVKHLLWKYDFMFQKHIKITNDTLKITFTIHTKKPMPFMLGYHPAFVLSGKNSELFTTETTSFSLQDVLSSGAKAYPLLHTNKIVLALQSGKKITLQTTGFNNLMLWSEVNNMVCIEPITQYPDLENQQYSDKNMRICKDVEEFSVTINVD